MQENDIDRIFSKGLKDKHTIPPASIWHHIEANITQERKRKQRRQRRVLIRTVAACLLASTLAALLFIDADPENSSQAHRRLAESQPPRVTELAIGGGGGGGISSEPEQAQVIKSTPESPLYSAEDHQARHRDNRTAGRASPETTLDENSAPSVRAVEVFPRTQPIREVPENTPKMPERPLQTASLTTSSVATTDLTSDGPTTDDNLIVSLLNVLSKNLIPSGNEVQFSNDEEGTINIGVSKKSVRQKL